MQIYIDESGPFAIPLQKKYWAISCVGALAIKDSDHQSLLDAYISLKTRWGYYNQEIKGSKLNELQAAELISVVSKFDVLFDLCAIDMARHSADDFLNHKNGQANALIKQLDLRFCLTQVQEWIKLRNAVLKMSAQLYAQGICGWQVIASMLQKSTLYFSQKSPSDLSHFLWTFDSKDKVITPFENTWKSLSLPILESMSVNSPLITVSDFDYSYFEKFCDKQNTPPDRLCEVVSPVLPFQTVNLKSVFGNCTCFEQSSSSIGLQLIDNLITIARRAMNGNMQPLGWGGLGRLMVEGAKDKQPLQLIEISKKPTKPNHHHPPPYFNVVNVVNKTCKPILCS